MKCPLPWRALAFGALSLTAVPALAIDPFEALISDGNSGQSIDLGFSKATDLFDSVNPEEFAQRLNYSCDSAPGVTCDAINAAVGFRGIPVTFAFAANSANLVFSVPGLNFQHTFVGNTNTGSVPLVTAGREDAIRQLKDFVKKDPAFLKRFLTLLAQGSPIDPLAGNPTSLFSKFQSRDFSEGFTHKVSQVWGCGTSAFNFSNDAPVQVAAVGGVSDIFAEANSRAAELQAENEIGMGIQAANVRAPSTGGTYASNSFDIPLSYTVKFDADPSYKLRFDLPITVTDTGGAKSYAVGFGIAPTFPFTDAWTITPGVGVGATGSTDLGSAGGVGAASLTSAYTLRVGSMAFSLGDAVGYYKSLGLKLGDIEAKADIKDTVFTNGLLMTGPSSLIASNLVMEYSITDTRITGTTVYSKYYDEAGIALGHIGTEQGVITSYIKAGVSYLVGDHDIKGIKLNLSSRF